MVLTIYASTNTDKVMGLDMNMDESSTLKTALSEKIAGEITLSPKPGQTIRKWREIFEISQSDLAHYLQVSPSVISDYESGRRKSPGIQVIKRLIEGFIEIDEKKNDGRTLLRYQSFGNEKNDGVVDIMEYHYGIPMEKFIEHIDGTLLTSKATTKTGRDVNGFTLVDSIKTITMLNSSNYVKLYGWSTDRALIFTGVRYGRSPMIAIRIHPVKPALVVYHQPGEVDPLAVKLAEREHMPLVTTEMPLQELRKKLIAIRTE